MRKVVIHRAGGYERLQLEEAATPEPGPGELRIAVAAIGVNYADCVIRMGLYASAKEYVGWPIRPGFEVAGVVSGLGAGVDGWALGQPVMAVTRFGGYAGQICVPAAQVFTPPAGLATAEASGLPTIFLTADHALHTLARAGRGEWVLVHAAAGGVGSALVQLAARAGCRVVGVVGGIHYLPERAHAERCERERLFISRDVLFEHLRALIGEDANVRASAMEEHDRAAFVFGVEAAPLFIGFALWIAEQAVVKRLDRLFFLTREGEFFRRIFATLFPDGKVFGHSLPPYLDLEVSRLSTFAASLSDVSTDELSRLWRLFRTQRIGGLFATLGLSSESFEGLLAELGLSPDVVVERPESGPVLAQLLV